MDDAPSTPPEGTKRNLLPGVLLILFGLFFLAANFLDIEFHHLWPAFLIAPALYFYFRAFQNRSQYGLLMPGTVLLIAGAVFITCESIGWSAMQHLWPMFILAPGIGFFLLYWFGRREKGLLVPGSILTAIAVMFLMSQGGIGRFWPGILIVAGVAILATKRDPS
jgi:hypothetical protein